MTDVDRCPSTGRECAFAPDCAGLGYCKRRGETISTWNTSDESLREENERLRSALAKADAEVTVLSDALRAAGMAPMMVQAIIDSATPRGKVAT